MNFLFRTLCILFPPRLPRFGIEDVASTAEYYNRLARRQESSMNPPSARIGRVSARLALPMVSFNPKPGTSTDSASRRVARLLRETLLIVERSAVDSKAKSLPAGSKPFPGSPGTMPALHVV
jgi:hypothetical protein